MLTSRHIGYRMLTRHVELKTSWFVTIMSPFSFDDDDEEDIRPKYWSELDGKIHYGIVRFFFGFLCIL
jgi:hypothetical protein